MYRKILLPVNALGTNLSDKAVRHVEFLATVGNGEITLLNVLSNSSRSLLCGFTTNTCKLEAYMKEESEEKMCEVAQLFDVSMSRIHTWVVFGNMCDEILATSNNEELDVIMVSPHKPSILTHLLGSNTESILRYTKTPVPVVR